MSVLAVLAVVVGAQLLLGGLTFVVSDLFVQVLVWALATLALMLYVRQVIHQALLAEGAEHEIGPDSQCPECHRIVPSMLEAARYGARSGSAKSR